MAATGNIDYLICRLARMGRHAKPTRATAQNAALA